MQWGEEEDRLITEAVGYSCIEIGNVGLADGWKFQGRFSKRQMGFGLSTLRAAGRDGRTI